VEDNGFTCIRIPFGSNWKPGQHCFLRFTSFGVKQAISAHPFTICSTPPNNLNEQNELIFYIRHQRGFTAKLYHHALEHPGTSVPVLVDGPYGGINLQKYYEVDHLIVIAGGSGAGWCLPFIELFTRHQSMAPDEEHGQEICEDGKEGFHQRNKSGPLSLQVVLATRDNSSRIWFLRTVGELLSKYPATGSTPKVRVKIFLTGEAAEHVDLPKNGSVNPAYSKISDSSGDKVTVQAETQKATVAGEEFEGRPQLPLIIHEEAAKVAVACQSLGVYVCGPDTMQNDVRNAVAKENLNILKGSKAKEVYLHSEYFSWA
jgi:NAD(P)H-flavin reductase